MAVFPAAGIRGSRKKDKKQTVNKPQRSFSLGGSKQSEMKKMLTFSRRALDRIYSAVLLAVVVLSWSYVIYASRIAAHWMLEKRTAPLQHD